MIPPLAYATFFLGALAALTAMYVSDIRAIRREERFWADLRDQAMHGYAKVFDWAEESDW